MALEWLPEVPIFSSDYPHFEGSGDPKSHYDKELSSLPADTRSAFMGENLGECFARIGDPINA